MPFVKDGENPGFASTHGVPSTADLIPLFQIRGQIIRAKAFLQGKEGLLNMQMEPCIPLTVNRASLATVG